MADVVVVHHHLHGAAAVRAGCAIDLAFDDVRRLRDHRVQFASSILLHDWVTFISIVLVVGHLYLALIYPATRHALRGITRGTVRRDWAEHHHPKWAAEQPPVDAPQ